MRSRPGLLIRRHGKLVLAGAAVLLLALAGTSSPLRAQETERLPRVAAAVERATWAMSPGEAGDWVFACSNRGWCTMIGHDGLAFPNRVVANDTRSMALRLTVGPDGQVSRLEFIPDRQVVHDESDGIDWRTPFPLAIPRLRGQAVTVPFARGEWRGSDLSTVIAFLRQGQALEAHDPQSGRLRLRLPWVGFAAAMREVRQRQRAVQRWQRLARPDLGEVTLRTGVPLMVSGVPPVTAEQMDWCSGGIDAANLAAFDLVPLAQLWQHTCTGDARNETIVRYFTVTGRGEAQVLRLPGEMGFSMADRGWFWPNARFEADFGVIRSVSYALPGRSDCGSSAVWGWTGLDWVVIEQRIMPLCQGLESCDWMVTWHRPATVRPDETFR